jgi:hypothetical protein
MARSYWRLFVPLSGEDEMNDSLQGRLNLDDLVPKGIALRDVNDGCVALQNSTVNGSSLRHSDSNT